MQKTINLKLDIFSQAFIEFIVGSEAQCFYRSMYVYIASACLDLLASEKTKSFLSISLMLLVTVASQNDFHGVALLG